LTGIADLKDIELKDKIDGNTSENKVSENASPADQEEEEDADETKAIFNLVADKYPMSSIWYMVVIAFCAMRAATGFMVALAYLSLIFRVIQVVSFSVSKNMMIAYVSYGISSFFIVIMFFAAMVNEKDESS
jgi:hypothetical protein